MNRFTLYFVKCKPHNNYLAGPSGRAFRGVDLERLHAETLCLNPAQGKDVCPRLFIIHLSSYHRRYIV
jgi:hypothetical protein